jgi:hypothetical protein
VDVQTDDDDDPLRQAPGYDPPVEFALPLAVAEGGLAAAERGGAGRGGRGRGAAGSKVPATPAPIAASPGPSAAAATSPAVPDDDGTYVRACVCVRTDMTGEPTWSCAWDRALKGRRSGRRGTRATSTPMAAADAEAPTPTVRRCVLGECVFVCLCVCVCVCVCVCACVCECTLCVGVWTEALLCTRH